MEKIEQKIIKLYEDGINYQLNNKEKNKYEYNEENTIANHDEFISMLEYRKGVSIITGSNGIGKTYFLKLINSRFDKAKRKTILLELKKYNNLSEIKNKILDEHEIVIFDGLDEINVNIIEEVINYIFKIDSKKVIVSSRKDFLQKNNMLSTTYNIYEIAPIEECKVIEILKNRKIDNSEIEDIRNLLKIPRFLIYIIDNIEQINNMEKINKYNILNLIVNNHFDTLNNRANTKIEKNIHKKILQSMALVMMMSGKINLTIEEFTTFLSRIKYLDIKSYILSKDIIESFLNNQLLINDGEILQFENKELLEFLAAKEIIENNFSNSDLYKIVINENKEIDPFWFNTIAYLVCEHEVYRKLILEYVYNNIEKQDNLLNLLFNINFETEDKEYIVRICQKMVFQYTKLYQYLSYNDNYISNIIRVNYKNVLKELSNILTNIDFNSKIDEFNTIYINNILSIIDNILDNYVPNDLNELDDLKHFLVINEEKIMNDNRFKVRYLAIYLKIMDVSKIDNMLNLYTINNRLLSIILHECKMISKLQKLDDIINTYIMNYKDRFEEEVYFYIDDTLIKEFIINNYNVTRIKRLLNKLNSDRDVASFLRFINNNIDILNIFNRKTIVDILNRRIIKRFLKPDSKSNKDLREEIMFDRRRGDAFEKIVELCIKHKYILVTDLTNIDLSNYIIQYICELIIKKLLENNTPIQRIYDALTKKELIFYVWKNDISNDKQNKYENEIKKLFPDLYKDYILMINKIKNRDYVDTENSLKRILEAKNIFYMIEKTYDLIKNDNKYRLIISNTIMKNIFKQIIAIINEYVLNLDIAKLQIKYNSKEKSYTLSRDFQFYSQAIYVMKKGNININKYNDKNIILLRESNDELNVLYSQKEYMSLINYLKNEASEGYIRFYLYQIIGKLKIKNINELYDMIIEWIDKYDFEEYEINQFLSVIYENIDSIDKTKLNKINRFREYKTCQDLLILLNIESEIVNRINYIKENLVYSGDMMDIEKNGNFEYSSGYYTNPLSKIDIKYIKYIIDITEFAFKKYNEGDYFYFVKYILDMVTNFIKNNIKSSQIIPLIKKIVDLEKDNNNRYLFNICNFISTMKKTNIKQLGSAITELNSIIERDFKKIYSYDELLNMVKEILEKDIFNDIKRMDFFELFRIKKGQLNKLNEQTFQFLIGYELSRILKIEGFNTEVIYESTGFDKKRNDIQLVSEGFIQNIVIETKLTENADISNEENIKQYINTTLRKYMLEFNSPKILFVLINQTKSYNNCEKKIKIINNNNEDFVLPILIDLKSIFDSKK